MFGVVCVITLSPARLRLNVYAITLRKLEETIENIFIRNRKLAEVINHSKGQTILIINYHATSFIIDKKTHNTSFSQIMAVIHFVL